MLHGAGSQSPSSLVVVVVGLAVLEMIAERARIDTVVAGIAGSVGDWQNYGSMGLAHRQRPAVTFRRGPEPLRRTHRAGPSCHALCAEVVPKGSLHAGNTARIGSRFFGSGSSFPTPCRRTSATTASFTGVATPRRRPSSHT